MCVSHQNSWFWTFLWVKAWCSSPELRGGPDPDAQTKTINTKSTHTLSQFKVMALKACNFTCM